MKKYKEELRLRVLNTIVTITFFIAMGLSFINTPLSLVFLLISCSIEFFTMFIRYVWKKGKELKKIKK